MSLPAKSYQQWLHAIAPGSSMAGVAKASGIKRSTLAQQLMRGKVAENTIISISRAFDANVVTALASFDKYADLAAGIKAPTEAELISQVSDLDLLQQILTRNNAREGLEQVLEDRLPGQGQELSPLPHRTSVRNWIDAIDSINLRQRIARDLQIAPQNLSAQISANRMPPDVAVQAARLAGVGLTNGLVIAGLLTPDEAGWPAGAREAALSALPDTELVVLSAARLDALGKTLRRIDADNDQTRALWENLG